MSEVTELTNEQLVKIGDLRRQLFMTYDCAWNGLVRDITAKLEQPGELVSRQAVQSELNKHCALLMQAKEIQDALSTQGAGPRCPKCGSDKMDLVVGARTVKCSECSKKFSLMINNRPKGQGFDTYCFESFTQFFRAPSDPPRPDEHELGDPLWPVYQRFIESAPKPLPTYSGWLRTVAAKLEREHGREVKR